MTSRASVNTCPMCGALLQRERYGMYEYSGIDEETKICQRCDALERAAIEGIPDSDEGWSLVAQILADLPWVDEQARESAKARRVIERLAG